jgi:endonuclease/exonuclease/phosphatase family metal-dependent hydrolase
VEKRLKEKFIYDKDIIVVGDFNIPSVKSKLYDAVTQYGLRMPKAIAGEQGSNLDGSKRYDQILHYPTFSDAFTNKGGVLDFYRGDHRPLFPAGPSMTKTAFTYQLSDHLPLWIEVNTDNDAEQLEQILNRKKK